MDEVLGIIVIETNKYVTQKGRNFETTIVEIIAFLGINFIIAINRLPTVEHY